MRQMYLLASIVVSLLAASSAPTPLYAIYQAEWGFSPMTTTVVFGVYAVAVLLALLVFGRLSDHVGRRPVLFVALPCRPPPWWSSPSPAACPSCSSPASSRAWPPARRWPRSAPACSTSTGSAARRANAVAPGIGTGGGALLSALVVQFLPGADPPDLPRAARRARCSRRSAWR